MKTGRWLTVKIERGPKTKTPAPSVDETGNIKTKSPVDHLKLTNMKVGATVEMYWQVKIDI